jgi:predicted Rossmann fold flavoprotein
MAALTELAVFDVIVLGAGAAGMMAAAEAAQRGHRVLLVEHGDRPGRKILISGGGRCNFTNVGTRAENFLSANPHFARSALAGYTPQEFITLVERHGIRYHEKTLGQLFCDDSAQRIVTMLTQMCSEAGVTLRTGVRVDSVEQGDAARFRVHTSYGALTAHSVIVATGGLSIPKLGAMGIAYDIARSFGHGIVETRAALVPLVFAAEDRERWCDLTGLATATIAYATALPQAVALAARKASPPRFAEKLLITHRGLSGPAVLQASSYWQPGSAVAFDLAPGQMVFTPLLQSNAPRDASALLHALRAVLPARLAERWLAVQPALRFTNAALMQLEESLHAWRVTPAGTEGYAKAEVTAGGVDTRELHAATCESKRVPGLYFIGECVDVTGWLGGYNFQWAWASAVAAARGLTAR